jgi:hypothetical protein
MLMRWSVPSPHVRMSIHPEGLLFSDLGSGACSERPSRSGAADDAALIHGSGLPLDVVEHEAASAAVGPSNCCPPCHRTE